MDQTDLIDLQIIFVFAFSFLALVYCVHHIHLEGDQPAEQPDRPDRELLQDARGLQPRLPRPQRQQNLIP